MESLDRDDIKLEDELLLLKGVIGACIALETDKQAWELPGLAGSCPHEQTPNFVPSN
ncbi:hypothetical protein CCACVL1_19329 [Corchorus capsularis]|uniref:Uncharacterized protein n=1 Tax=Corchorus capsularis TaxID=210143 RepID=A0A1R3HHD0_COCAP|nr:hypothetical protein CCACVL1_19329 [Corchorus capsularis]